MLDQSIGEHWHHVIEPDSRSGKKIGCEVIQCSGRSRFAIPGDGHDLRVVIVQVERHALIFHLRHDEWTGTRDEPESQFVREIDKGTEIETIAGVTIEIELAADRLVTKPRNVTRHRIAAGIAQLLQSITPIFTIEPVIVNFPRDDELRFAINQNCFLLDLNISQVTPPIRIQTTRHSTLADFLM